MMKYRSSGFKENSGVKSVCWDDFREIGIPTYCSLMGGHQFFNNYYNLSSLFYLWCCYEGTVC